MTFYIGSFDWHIPVNEPSLRRCYYTLHGRRRKGEIVRGLAGLLYMEEEQGIVKGLAALLLVEKIVSSATYLYLQIYRFRRDIWREHWRCWRRLCSCLRLQYFKLKDVYKDGVNKGTYVQGYNGAKENTSWETLSWGFYFSRRCQKILKNKILCRHSNSFLCSSFPPLLPSKQSRFFPLQILLITQRTRRRLISS